MHSRPSGIWSISIQDQTVFASIDILDPVGIETTDIGKPVDDGAIDFQDIVGPQAIHQDPCCNELQEFKAWWAFVYRHQDPGGIGLQEFKTWWAFVYRQSRPRWHWATGIQDLVGICL
jgi:hypothetical protein